MDFLKQSPRFSFLYDGLDFHALSPKIHQAEENNLLTTEYLLPDGLKVTNIARKYPDFDAWEWVNWLEMTGDAPSRLITDLCDCDAIFPFPADPPFAWTTNLPDPTKTMKVFAPDGSNWSDGEFYCDANRLEDNRFDQFLYPGFTQTYSPIGGRSCHGKAPFFNIFRQNAGLIFAIGWSGQWNCQISRLESGPVNIKTKVEDTHFRLLPGEKIRTSSIVLMPYACDYDDAQNKWRRLVKTHFSLISQPGRDRYAPVFLNVWGGMKTHQVLDRIKLARDIGLPTECLWMDAGWYGTDERDCPDEYEGFWWQYVGDWRVNTHLHPDGLLEVRKALNEANMKFLLWFEPERVRVTTPIAREHPEYFLSTPESQADGNLLLNLGNEDAWQYIFEALSKVIEDLELDWYRQDFNFFPLSIWRANDAEDRRGLTEIKHIGGLYRLWDALLARFPHLMIDDCAGGGKRIDIELLRRSMPLWRSDAQCPSNCSAEMTQLQNMNYAAWMPYSATGANRTWCDDYKIRSAYAGALSTNYLNNVRLPLENDLERLLWLKARMEEYLRVRPYFYEDFYPLTDQVKADLAWCASQYHRPSQNDGIVQVFKRENSPYLSALFRLKGLEPAKTYTFSDADDETARWAYSGQQLMEEGFEVTIRSAPTAKIYFYRES